MLSCIFSTGVNGAVFIFVAGIISLIKPKKSYLLKNKTNFQRLNVVIVSNDILINNILLPWLWILSS